MAGSLAAVGREIRKYKLDLAGIQKVRWNRDTQLAVSYRNGNEN
jgi:hypothetical protein